MKSKIFEEGKNKDIEKQIKTLIDGKKDIISKSSSDSTRAAGDAIQNLLSNNFKTIIEPYCNKYENNFARRAMADLAFEDKDSLYYVLDVKTHRKSTKFNMPNLISVERIARFYEDPKNYFCIVMISYDVSDETKINVDSVKFIPIEFLDWECLTIGALGWGQIQIANSNKISTNEGYSRKKWMIELCDSLLEFYPKEIAKIHERVDHFKAIKKKWEEMPDE